MDNLRIIYRILKILEQAMDYDEFDMLSISPERLNISENRWTLIMEMLIYEGYITRAVKIKSCEGIKLLDIHITLKGLEYLEENSFMKRAANLAKGISDMIP